MRTRTKIECVAGYPATDFVFVGMWTLFHPFHSCPVFQPIAEGCLLDIGAEQSQPSIMQQGYTVMAWT